MRGIVLSESLLIIGIIIAASITILQIRGVFISQQQIAQEEAIVSFAKDLESIINRAIASTSDVAFVYYPSIRSYRIEVLNNTVYVFDKASNKTASFSKAVPEIVENYLEDCEKIFVVKKEGKIILSCKCLEIGESCSNSLQCCSGYCNLTIGRCTEPPVCPTSPIDRRCYGASLSEAPPDSNGVPCCPSDKPICSEKHCCPLNQPKWCETPNTGNARCMDSTEYASECKVISLKILVIPVNWDSGFNSYDSVADSVANYFLQRIPLSECPERFKYFKADGTIAYGAHWINWYCYIPSENIQNCYDGGKALDNIYKCAEEYKTQTGEDYDYVVGIDDSNIGLFDIFSGHCYFNVGGWSDGFGGYTSVIAESSGFFIPTHELGHEFGLADEYCDCSGTAYANYCGPTVPINPLKEELGCKAGPGQGCCDNYGNGPYDPACGWCKGNFDRFGIDTNADGKLDSGHRSIMSNINIDHHDSISYAHLKTLPKLKC